MTSRRRQPGRSSRMSRRHSFSQATCSARLSAESLSGGGVASRAHASCQGIAGKNAARRRAGNLSIVPVRGVFRIVFIKKIVDICRMIGILLTHRQNCGEKRSRLLPCLHARGKLVHTGIARLLAGYGGEDRGLLGGAFPGGKQIDDLFFGCLGVRALPHEVDGAFPLLVLDGGIGAMLKQSLDAFNRNGPCVLGGIMEKRSSSFVPGVDVDAPFQK